MNWKKQIFILLFWTSIALIYIILWWVFSVITLLLSLAFYIALSYIIYIVWKKLRKKQRQNIMIYGQMFLYKSAIMLSIIWIILWSFVYYNNELSPAQMPSYQLSNWEKQVIFQAMIHIANPDFYSQIKSDIKTAKQDWYVYYFEWVKPGTPENSEKFNQALWIDFSPELYKNFSKLYWVVHQDQKSFLDIENNLDFNIDLSLDEIMELYEARTSWNSLSPIGQLPPRGSQEQQVPLVEGDVWGTKTGGVIDINTEIVNRLAELSDNQLKILTYFNQALLNFFTRNESLRNTVIEKMWNQDIFTVILDDRNKLLANEIISSEHNKIYITYGLLHFEWVFELLKNADENWEINKIEHLFPIQ